MYVAIATNARHVATFTTLPSPQVAMSAFPRISARNRYRKVTATPARFESTMMIASTSPQPHIQPMCGPNALTVHVNDVPASGTALLRSR